MTRDRGYMKVLVWLAVLLLVTGCGSKETVQVEKRYPLEAVQMLAPAGPGSGYDLAIRSVVQCLENTGMVDVPLPVTNKPGGGGGVALKYLKDSMGRDDVLSIFSPPLCLIYLNGSTELNYQEHTTPVAKLAVDYGCFAVRSDSPYKDLQQLMEALKEDIHAVTIGGTSSEGSLDHIQFLKVAGAAGVKNLKEIEYEGFENGGAVAQLMGNRVDVLSVGISDVVGLMERGDIRVLAITSENRLSGDIISQIPTCREQGIDAEFCIWRGLFGPKNMPEYARAYWEQILKDMTETEEWKNICLKYGWEMDYQNSKEFCEFLDQVNEEYKELLRIIYEED